MLGILLFNSSNHYHYILHIQSENLSRSLGNLKDTTVADLSSLKLIHTVSNTLDRHWELLDNWLNIVQGSERQHISVDLAGSNE